MKKFRDSFSDEYSPKYLKSVLPFIIAVLVLVYALLLASPVFYDAVPVRQNLTGTVPEDTDGK